MMRYSFITILLISVTMEACEAQSLKTHQWQNRILLVIAEDTSNINFQKQIKYLQSNKEDLTERKLLIYKVFPNQYIKGLDNSITEPSNDLYQKYNSKSASFKVVLIGLDGGVKLKQKDIITLEQLKGIIDAMPMRMEELRKKERE